MLEACVGAFSPQGPVHTRQPPGRIPATGLKRGSHASAPQYPAAPAQDKSTTSNCNTKNRPFLANNTKSKSAVRKLTTFSTGYFVHTPPIIDTALPPNAGRKTGERWNPARGEDHYRDCRDPGYPDGRGLYFSITVHILNNTDQATEWQETQSFSLRTLSIREPLRLMAQ